MTTNESQELLSPRSHTASDSIIADSISAASPKPESSRLITNGDDVVVPADELEDDFAESESAFGRRESAWCEPWLWSVAKVLLLVLLWYTFSMALSLYNKVLIGEKHGRFPAPLMMTTFHFLLQGGVASLMLRCCCPAWLPPTPISWRDYFLRVVPTAVATALDIGLSNLSLALITLTFYTMCKSSAPVFLLLFAFLFRLEAPSFKLLGIMLVISIGVLFTVAGETEFQLLGFILVMVAAFVSGLRWVLLQVLLQGDKLGLTNPLLTLAYLAPVMAAVCGVFSLLHEPWSTLSSSPYFDTWPHALWSLVIMIIGGILAFCMIMAEFMLVLETSAVTFSVAGTVKEGVTIVVSHLVFGDRFTRINLVGILVIMFGVSLFNLYKLSRSKARESDGHLVHTLSDDGPLPAHTSMHSEQQQLLHHSAPSSSALAPICPLSPRGNRDDTHVVLATSMSPRRNPHSRLTSSPRSPRSQAHAVTTVADSDQSAVPHAGTAFDVHLGLEMEVISEGQTEADSPRAL